MRNEGDEIDVGSHVVRIFKAIDENICSIDDATLLSYLSGALVDYSPQYNLIDICVQNILESDFLSLPEDDALKACAKIIDIPPELLLNSYYLDQISIERLSRYINEITIDFELSDPLPGKAFKDYVAMDEKVKMAKKFVIEYIEENSRDVGHLEERALCELNFYLIKIRVALAFPFLIEKLEYPEWWRLLKVNPASLYQVIQ